MDPDHSIGGPRLDIVPDDHDVQLAGREVMNGRLPHICRLAGFAPKLFVISGWHVYSRVDHVRLYPEDHSVYDCLLLMPDWAIYFSFLLLGFDI